MVNHYFDLQIRVTMDDELSLEEQLIVQNHIREMALALRLASMVRTGLSSLGLGTTEISIGNAALAWLSDENDEEI